MAKIIEFNKICKDDLLNDFKEQHLRSTNVYLGLSRVQYLWVALFFRWVGILSLLSVKKVNWVREVLWQPLLGILPG